MAIYSNTSPWFDTAIINSNLSYFNIRPVSAEPDDILYQIDAHYNYRPDLLAYSLYDTPKLWWVFAQRNMDIIRDPIFDFKTGVSIYLPQKTSLFQLLGL